MLGGMPSLLLGVWWKLYEKYSTPAVSPQKQDDVSLLEAGKSPHLGSNPKENEEWTYLSVLKSTIKRKAAWLRQSLQN